MEEYIEKLISQVRCKKARPYIEAEIRGHIEEQIEDNIDAGMNQEEAVKNAVADMGDPVATGIELDRIHKPQIAWSMLVIVGIVSLIGILIHFLLSRDINELAESGKYIPQSIYSYKNYYSGVIIGLALMLAIYFIDYSFIVKYSRIIGGVILFIGLVGVILGNNIYGVSTILNGKLQIVQLIMLYVPIYGAIMYKYRNTGLKGLMISVAWMLAPIIEAVLLPNIYLAFVLYVTMFPMLIIAVIDGWFTVPKKRAVISLCTAFALSPIVALGGLILSDGLLTGYQKARIHAWVHPGYESGEIGYMSHNLKEQIMNSIMIGSNSNGAEILGSGENYTSDFIFTYITGTYGILAGVLLCIAIATLIFMVFAAATKQKNRVGMLMGCGCGILLLVITGINILENVGLFPISQTFLPFISSGRYSIVLSYVLTGIVMSVYRYKDVYPRHFTVKSIMKKNVKVGQ